MDAFNFSFSRDCCVFKEERFCDGVVAYFSACSWNYAKVFAIFVGYFRAGYLDSVANGVFYNFFYNHFAFHYFPVERNGVQSFVQGSAFGQSESAAFKNERAKINYRIHCTPFIIAILNCYICIAHCES